MPLAHNNFADLLRRRQDTRAISLDRKFSTQTPSMDSGLSSTADPYSANAAHKIATSREPFIVMGRIAEVVEYAKAYRVRLERGGGLILCCELHHTSNAVMGAKQLNTYVPETMVLVAWHPHASYGIILGSVPDWMIAGRDAISDYIVQGGNVGLHVDQVHSYPLQLNDDGGIVDWSAGGAFDNIADGDWGAVTDTGGMVFLDPFMTFMRVDEETGIFFFYDNQRGRLAAHNLQIRSGAHEFEAFEDQSEADSWEGYTTGAYHERMGKFEDGSRHREIQPEDYQLTEPWFTRFEPEEDDQQAFFRLRIFRGYFGQGDSHMLCIPPVDAEGVQQYSQELKLPGVAEEHWNTDGMISIRSAKGLIIAKRAILPNPKQIAVPEDPTGDISNCTDDNYRFRGKVSCLELPDHKVGDMTDTSEKESLVRAAAFRDLYSLKEMHKDLLGLRYHDLDWYVPNESDYPFADEMQNGILDYSILCKQQWLDPPDPIQLKVDDRYNDGDMVNYWPTDSYLAMLEDGGLILADGFGFELRTVDGSAIMSAPGDIWMLPGRSFHCWAGWDVTVRGNNCVDIVANRCDVRIKAENNCLIMGGNDICGGVLIESKSPAIDFECNDESETIGGIIIRAKHSAVVTYGAQINLTLSGEGEDENADPPSIVLNAKKGLILTDSKHFFRFITASAQDAFVDDECTVCAVNEYWCTSTMIDNPLRVFGDTFIHGCTLTSGDIGTIGHVTSVRFDKLDDMTPITNAISDLEDRESDLFTWAESACSDPSKLEDDTDVLDMEFYFRSTKQLKMEDLVLFETKWQQEARVNDMNVEKWTENAVDGEDCFMDKDDFSYPPPGKQAWKDDSDWYNQDQTLFDLETNLMEDWGPDYEYPTPTYADPTNQPFDGNFLIIRNTCVDCPPEESS